MSVKQVVIVDSLESTITWSIRFELNVNITSSSWRRLVSFPLKAEFSARFHTRTNKDFFSCLLFGDSFTIDANYLSLEACKFFHSTEEVVKGTCNRHIDITHFVGQNLIETAWSSSKVTSLDLSSFGVDDISKWILFKEKLVKNLITVLTVHVASTTDFVRAYDPRAESFSSILFVDGPQLLWW